MDMNEYIKQALDASDSEAATRRTEVARRISREQSQRAEAEKILRQFPVWARQAGIEPEVIHSYSRQVKASRFRTKTETVTERGWHVKHPWNGMMDTDRRGPAVPWPRHHWMTFREDGVSEREPPSSPDELIRAIQQFADDHKEYVRHIPWPS
jgi:hypothetical protein